MNKYCLWSLSLILAHGSNAAPLPDRLAVIGARVEAGCRSLERELTRPNPQPSVRQLTAGALGLLELDQPVAGAEKLLRHTFGLQVMDSESTAYGTVPWQEGHPEIKDPNAIEFTMQPVGVIWLRHSGRLSAAFKQEAEPHLRAAITAIHRHNVPVKYSNIYLMKLVNLLLLGQAVGDRVAVAEGKANFDTWLAFTRTNGAAEYDSPTYSPIQADCLILAHNLTDDSALKARLKAALDFYWADFAANYFLGRQTMAGPASRDYNFLFSDSNVDYAYYLAGLRSLPPADTFLTDSVRAWTAARMGGYWPSGELLALAGIPERVVKTKFGAAPGQDRYLWLTPDFTLGSASAYYGPQDKRLCAELASLKKLPVVSVVVDDYDSPFGLVRAKDWSGHNKPHHLSHLLATVQEKGFVLALMDLAPAIQTEEFTNLASNVVLPVQVEGLRLNGKQLDGSRPFDLAASPEAVVGLREGKAGLAIRLFVADGAAGQSPVWNLGYDGNEQGAGRLTVYHYRGPARKLADPHLRCGLVLLAAQCNNEAEFASLLKRAADLRLTQGVENGIWQAKAVSGSLAVEAGLGLTRKRVAWRRVNGQAWQPEVLSVNGRDWAAETLGRVN